MRDNERETRVLEEGGMNEPAFPINGGIAENQYNGMTLRDYFAAKAMAAMIGTAGASCLGGLDHTEARTAQAAYHMADAMLAARTK